MIFAMSDYLDIQEHIKAVDAHKRRARRIALLWFFIVAFVVSYFGLGVMRAEAAICQVLLSRDYGDKVELVANADGFQVGYLYYRMVDTERATVNVIKIQDEYKGQGISKALFYGMLQREKQIKHIEAILIQDNLRVSGLWNAPQDVSDERCFEAANRTPFVKAWRRFGFELVECYHNAMIGSLEVELKLGNR